MIPYELRQRIITYLISIPNIGDRNAKQALIAQCSYPLNLVSQCDNNSVGSSWASDIISTLLAYQETIDEDHPLITLLKVASSLFGREGKAKAEALISELLQTSYTLSEEHVESSYQQIYHSQNINDLSDDVITARNDNMFSDIKHSMRLSLEIDVLSLDQSQEIIQLLQQRGLQIHNANAIFVLIES